MFTLFDRTDDVEEIARAGIAAGSEFDDGSELPVAMHVVELRSDEDKLKSDQSAVNE